MRKVFQIYTCPYLFFAVMNESMFGGLFRLNVTEFEKGIIAGIIASIFWMLMFSVIV